jgi:hypothetical protein
MVHDYRAVYPTTLYPVVSINQIGIIHKFGDCLKTGPEACWQVDTFSEHLTGAQSPQNNMITSV